ncbi:hypothetical protein B0H17DRAFT_1149175 [Mycena rosella]|uniref:Uncharacterized protein n=1 Tax=Mycena rosella TaxID=1033263 RepID=A0AAD7C693_MYCRO|nr:hypothetical protein B0H17DRAFT_1149175 [Mycena rosella]
MVELFDGLTRLVILDKYRRLTSDTVKAISSDSSYARRVESLPYIDTYKFCATGDLDKTRMKISSGHMMPWMPLHAPNSTEALDLNPAYADSLLGILCTLVKTPELRNHMAGEPATWILTSWRVVPLADQPVFDIYNTIHIVSTAGIGAEAFADTLGLSVAVISHMWTISQKALHAGYYGCAARGLCCSKNFPAWFPTGLYPTVDDFARQSGARSTVNSGALDGVGRILEAIVNDLWNAPAGDRWMEWIDRGGWNRMSDEGLDQTWRQSDGLFGGGAAFDHDAMRENIIFLTINGIDVPFSTNPWSIHELWGSFWSSGSAFN